MLEAALVKHIRACSLGAEDVGKYYYNQSTKDTHGVGILYSNLASMEGPALRGSHASEAEYST